MAGNERYTRIKEVVSSAQVAADHGLELQDDGQGREKTLCPYHDDHDPSLKLFADGRYKCFVCDAAGDAVSLEQRLGGYGSASEAAAALEERHYLDGLSGPVATVSDIRRPRKPGELPSKEAAPKKNPKKPKPKRVGEDARWTIRDANGEPQAIHIRYKTRGQDGVEGKDYSYRNADGDFEAGAIKTKELPLYLSEIISGHDPAEAVILVEGEKAADAAVEAGLKVVATTAGTNVVPEPECLEVLRGRKLVLWPDNDRPGKKHMAEMAEALEEIASEVRWFTWVEAPEKGDAADHPAVTSGEGLNDLREVLRDAPEYDPDQHRPEDTRKVGGGQEGGAGVVREAPAHNSSGGANQGTGSYNQTDYGNAERLVYRHGADLRYCHTWAKWLVWDGRRWAIDETGELGRRAKDAVRAIYTEAAVEPDDTIRKALAAHAKRSEADGKMNAMISLAESEPGIPVRPGEMDADPWLLTVANGTLDLRTGDLQPHNRNNLITKLAPVDYDPGATAPTWEAFLGQVLPAPDMRSFVQRLVGYALTGKVEAHILPILYGTGANGKSTLLTAILEMLGDYGLQAANDMLTAKGNAHPTERADLFGRRFVTNIETEEGRRLAESLVKQLTGGDRVRARRMREDFWEFSPTHTLFLATNHKPQVFGTDHAIWRRLRLIPFDVTIPVADQDRHLPEKLRIEMPGILRWAVEGCLAYQRDGLGEPAEVAAATAGYRSEMDVLAAFLEERCAVHDNASAPATPLYHKYREWCEETGEKVETQRSLGMRLTERGFERRRITAGERKGQYEWVGIGLLHPGDPPPGSGDNGSSKSTDGSPQQPGKKSSGGTKDTKPMESGSQTAKSGEPLESKVHRESSPEVSVKPSNKHTIGERSEPAYDHSSSKLSREGVMPDPGSLRSLGSPGDSDEDPEGEFAAPENAVGETTETPTDDWPTNREMSPEGDTLPETSPPEEDWMPPGVRQKAERILAEAEREARGDK